jgi:DNA-binding transcriptional regulator LsrR (DeoR family)
MTQEITQAEKNFLLGVARRTISKLIKKGRSADYIQMFVNSKRGRDYMANVANYVSSQVSL